MQTSNLNLSFVESFLGFTGLDRIYNGNYFTGCIKLALFTAFLVVYFNLEPDSIVIPVIGTLSLLWYLVDFSSVANNITEGLGVYEVRTGQEMMIYSIFMVSFCISYIIL